MLPFGVVALARVGYDWSYWKDKLSKCSEIFVFVCVCLCVYRSMWRPRDILGVIPQVPFTLIFEDHLLAWNSTFKSAKYKQLPVSASPGLGFQLCAFAWSLPFWLLRIWVQVFKPARQTLYWLNHLPGPKCILFCWPSFRLFNGWAFEHRKSCSKIYLWVHCVWNQLVLLLLFHTLTFHLCWQFVRVCCCLFHVCERVMVFSIVALWQLINPVHMFAVCSSG